MTGGDWVWIMVMGGFLILVFCMDRIIDADQREARRLDRDAADERLRREIGRQP